MSLNKFLKTALSPLLVLSFIFVSTTSLARKSKKSKKDFNDVYYGTVISCYDGDTCRVQEKDKVLKIRLHGIDAPEVKQSRGKDARDYINSLVKQKSVKLKCQGKSFDRLTCKMFIDLEEINKQMVAAGWAWDSPRYSKQEYKDLMLAAQKQKIGIWKTPPAESPYCFRHKKNKKCTKNQQHMD